MCETDLIRHLIRQTELIAITTRALWGSLKCYTEKKVTLETWICDINNRSWSNQGFKKTYSIGEFTEDLSISFDTVYGFKWYHNQSI